MRKKFNTMSRHFNGNLISMQIYKQGQFIKINYNTVMETENQISFPKQITSFKETLNQSKYSAT